MSKTSKVLWSEGLFLRPEHFQQFDRHHEQLRGLAQSVLCPHPWGLAKLEVEADLLRIGKFALREARGLFPDGRPFSMPDQDPLPPPIELNNEVRDQIVHLALPLASATATEFGRDAGQEELHRYRVTSEEVADTTGTSSDPVLMEVGALAPRLLLDSQPRDSYASIPVARIVEVSADKSVSLDSSYMPTVLHGPAAPALNLFIKELLGMLNQRAEALAARVASSGRGGSAEIADFLMLQVINRAQPTLRHLGTEPLLHPQRLYAFLLGLAGELATFTEGAKRPAQLPGYEHGDLQASFEPIIAALRASLSAVMEQTATPIPIKEKKYGVRVAMIPDKAMLHSSSFVMAVHADMPLNQLTQQLPTQAKIGPVEKIRDLVNLQLPGIGLKPLPAAPRQIPYHAGYAYFELDRSSKMWKELDASGGMAIYLADQGQGLALELWAIRAG